MFKESGIRWVWIAALIVMVDQYLKNWATIYLTMGVPRALLPMFNLTLAHNRGAAFSFLNRAGNWQILFFGGVAAIVSVAIVIWLIRLPARKNLLSIGLSFVLGGALGNLIDRVRFGYVVDFIDFYVHKWHWPAFNIADASIVLGATLLFITIIWKEKFE